MRFFYLTSPCTFLAELLLLILSAYSYVNVIYKVRSRWNCIFFLLANSFALFSALFGILRFMEFLSSLQETFSIFHKTIGVMGSTLGATLGLIFVAHAFFFASSQPTIFGVSLVVAVLSLNVWLIYCDPWYLEIYHILIFLTKFVIATIKSYEYPQATLQLCIGYSVFAAAYWTRDSDLFEIGVGVGFVFLSRAAISADQVNFAKGYTNQPRRRQTRNNNTSKLK